MLKYNFAENALAKRDTLLPQKPKLQKTAEKPTRRERIM
jgi:hypothetical protein